MEFRTIQTLGLGKNGKPVIPPNLVRDIRIIEDDIYRDILGVQTQETYGGKIFPVKQRQGLVVTANSIAKLAKLPHRDEILLQPALIPSGKTTVLLPNNPQKLITLFNRRFTEAATKDFKISYKTEIS